MVRVDVKTGGVSRRRRKLGTSLATMLAIGGRRLLATNAGRGRTCRTSTWWPGARSGVTRARWPPGALSPDLVSMPFAAEGG
ncbi:MAG TPA: hypothetical protein VGO86_14920 [Candidatus Dormibacteraeota bacterium]